jgi:hypothetical protein
MVTSSKNRTADENKVFYAEGLEKLRAEPLAESSGKLIMDLLDTHADKVLIPFARNWIKKFPKHEVAPRLAGKMLRLFNTNDAMYMSISYVKAFPDVKALNQIVLAAATLGGSGKKLLDAIEKRMEKNPNSHVWGFLQTRNGHDEFIDKLICRWISHNRANEDIVGSLSSVTLFTESLKVLEETLKWIELNQGKPNNRYIWMVLSHFFMGKSTAHKQFEPRAIDFARGWLERNPEDEYCGTIHKNVIAATNSADDILRAKNWIEQNPEHPQVKDVEALLKS